MKKNYLAIVLFLLFIALSSGCGGDSTAVPVISTPTISPTTVPSTPTPDIISTLTETNVKTSAISAKNGGTITEGNMTVEIPPGALEEDGTVEIAKVKINNITSSDVNEEEIYKISSGNKDDTDELQEPATVRIKAAEGQRPLTWNGGEWLPVDYSYDSATREIILELTCIDEDINEWTEEGEEEGTVDEPVIVGIGKSTDYQTSYKSRRFEVFFCNESDLDYAESIAMTLEKAYDYYVRDLKYNSPVRTNLVSGKSEHIYVYIYPSKSAPDFRKSSRGIAGAKGYMAFNKNLVDMNTDMGKSTCYHELLHLIQFSYTGREFCPNWFDESMAVCMQYYAMNKTRNINMYDLAGGRWRYDILKGPFDSNENQSYYYRYTAWSYIINKNGPEVLHRIMKKFKASDDLVRFNKIIGEETTSDFVTTFNNIAEDYYTGGTFFNRKYFNNLEERSSEQPYNYIISRDAVEPEDETISFSIKPFSVDYKCYSSKKFKGTVELGFSEVSSNCRVYIFPSFCTNGVCSPVNPEAVTGVNAVKTINNFGTNITDVFILVENTSPDSDAAATLKVKIKE